MGRRSFRSTGREPADSGRRPLDAGSCKCRRSERLSDDEVAILKTVDSRRGRLDEGRIAAVDTYRIAVRIMSDCGRNIGPGTRFAIRHAPRSPIASWPRDAIDGFCWPELERTSCFTVGDAEKLSRIRRVWFDLTGLPPRGGNSTPFSRDRLRDGLSSESSIVCWPLRRSESVGAGIGSTLRAMLNRPARRGTSPFRTPGVIATT